MSLSIPMTSEELALVKAYADARSLTLVEAFKEALFERIEDEQDILQATKSYEECLHNPASVEPMDELYKEFKVQ